jgi:N6-adenosine-specific RNA methylase IME4
VKNLDRKFHFYRRSRKPDEQLVAGPYLELFSRETKQGWESWGDQVALFDNGTVSTRHHPYRLVDAPTLPF